MTPDFEQKARELAPCPFCGGKATLESKEWYGGRTVSYQVTCDSCKAGTQFGFGDFSAASTAWNTRVPTQALQEMYEAGGAVSSDLVLRGLDIIIRGGWSPNDRRAQDEHFERLTRDTRQWAIDLATLTPTQGA